MAIRTPQAQERSQYHSHHGLYDPSGAYAGPIPGFDSIGLPNTAAATFPRAVGDSTPQPAADNILAPTAVLEAGDMAFNVADGCMYVCVNAGTPLGGDAVWECMNAPVSTRDAHQIVLGIDDSAKGADPLLLTEISDVDFLDAGDGVQLAAALAAADAIRVALGYAPDVRIRAGLITMVNNAFTVPVGVRLVGAGANVISNAASERNTILTAAAGAGVAILSQDAKLEELALVGAGDFANLAQFAVEGGQQIQRCRFSLSADNTVEFAAIDAVGALVTPDAGVLVEDCIFDFAASVTERCLAVDITGTSGVRTPVQVKNCRQFGGSTIIRCIDVSDSAVSDIAAYDVNGQINGGHAVEMFFQTAGAYRGPDLSDIRIKYSDALATLGGSETIRITAINGALVDGPSVRSIRVEGPAAPTNALGNVVAIGVGDDPSRIARGTIRDVVVEGDLPSLATWNTCILLNNASTVANVTPGAGISNIRISDCVMVSDPNNGRLCGVLLNSATAGAVISNCSVMNCSFPGDWQLAVLGVSATPVALVSQQAGDLSGSQVGFNVLGFSDGASPLPNIIQGSTSAVDVEAAHNVVSLLV